MEGVRLILAGLGEETGREGLRETPRRVADMLIEMTAGHEFAIATFENENGYDELILCKEIPFYSLCEHHLAPFFGKVTIGYFPGERLIGLSKLARLVDKYARRLQVQERMTQQIADWLEETLSPRGVGVVVRAHHTCMSMRGIKKTGTTMVTSALKGALLTHPESRAEFLSLAHGDSGEVF